MSEGPGLGSRQPGVDGAQTLLVAEWIHYTFGIILPTTNLKV